MNIFEKLAVQMEDPYARAMKEKEKGRKIIGITPMHFPEELVHASGAFPVLLQDSVEPVTTGYGHIYPFYCGFNRSTVDLAVKNKLDFLDAIVVSDVCLQTRHMSNIVRYNVRSTRFLYMQWPLEVNTRRWLDTAITRLQKCKKGLEEILDVEIKDSTLAKSIKLYNRNRTLLQRIYQIRRANPGVISARELMVLVKSSMLLPREETTPVFEELITWLEDRETKSDDKVRVFISGHLCQAVKEDILDLIEGLGMTVAGDDIYTGYRYISTNVSSEYKPLEALVHRYFELKVPCPTRMDPTADWADYLVKSVRETGARGIISLMVKHCEPHMIYFPHLLKKLADADIPHLLIETEHEVVSLAGIRTRLQAFGEMLKGQEN